MIGNLIPKSRLQARESGPFNWDVLCPTLIAVTKECNKNLDSKKQQYTFFSWDQFRNQGKISHGNAAL
jgi:hypothetical protein